jgi:hypothetical protein
MKKQGGCIMVEGKAYINGRKKSRKIKGIVECDNVRCIDNAVCTWFDCMFDELADGPATTVDDMVIDRITFLKGQRQVR